MLDAGGVDCLLVGDSLGLVLQGQSSTVPVTLQNMVYHTAGVARGNCGAWVIGDLPIGSYQESKEQAPRSATAAKWPVAAQMGSYLEFKANSKGTLLR